MALNSNGVTGTRLAPIEGVNVQSISWLLYLVGSLLVFGSWVDIVPAGVGWVGWLMALVGWAISHETRKANPQLSPA